MQIPDSSLHDAQPAPTASVSRRGFLTRAAVAAGVLAAPSAAPAQDPRVVLDASILNFLLRFEYVQMALYRAGVARFTQRDLAALGPNAYDILLATRDQEEQHVATLRSLVQRLGAVPVGECSSTFVRWRTLPDFLRVVLALENAGVSAYLGVLPLIRNAQLQSAVASIASVESRHAAYAGMVNGESPAPAAADTPRSREEILGILDPYIGTCPY